MPVINRGDDYFAVVTYTGNGTSQTISGLRFQPDFVWIKGRSGATDHALYDAVRGVQKRLESNTTDAEVTSDSGVTAFNADGFSIGSLAQVNTNSATYVAWCWKANGTGVTNTSGSITSTVSAGATQGFSVVTYTGTGANATVGHGLGVAPKMVICKNRSTSAEWYVYHASLGTNKALFLEQTAAASTSNLWWNNTAPTSTVFSIGNQTGNNGSGNSIVAYCFAEVAGYSKFGSYTGNGSADGPFIFCNFRPRWIMVKRTDSTGSWYMWDTSRDTYNWSYKWLAANLSDAENTSSGSNVWDIDILSNGFKIRNNGAFDNASGGTYIYAAFAENPTKFALAR